MSVTNFTTNLVTLRSSAKLTQSELARRLNSSRQQIWKWENGVSRPNADQLVPIADALGCTVDELVRPAQEAV